MESFQGVEGSEEQLPPQQGKQPDEVASAFGKLEEAIKFLYHVPKVVLPAEESNTQEAGGAPKEGTEVPPAPAGSQDAEAAAAAAAAADAAVPKDDDPMDGAGTTDELDQVLKKHGATLSPEALEALAKDWQEVTSKRRRHG